VGRAKGPEISSVTPDPSAVTVHMHHSLIQLPDAQYRPRAFDPRAGYYANEYLDYATPIDQPIMQRQLMRHRLEKQDPGAALSDPVQPIVYYLDRGAPEPIRSALMEGAAWWNQAFEAAGYRNAFQVQLLPAGVDPMDIRYNLIQWVHRSTRGWSYGASIADPRTGEIIKGHVSLGSLRVRQDFLIAEGLLQPYEEGKPTSPEMLRMAVARLRQLAAHEVGHTLGLYHNYSASTRDRASVMDYPMPRIKTRPDGSIDLSEAYGVGIGPWDKRAILYGYQDFGPAADEAAALKAIMAQTLAEGHVFISDADARAAGGAHPAAHLWDDGPNAADELNRLLDVRRQLLARFSEKALAPGQPMARLEEVLVPIYLLQRYQVEAAAKTLGGLYYTYAVKGDGQTITKLVEPAEQWKAFDALMRTISPRELALVGGPADEDSAPAGELQPQPRNLPRPHRPHLRPRQRRRIGGGHHPGIAAELPTGGAPRGIPRPPPRAARPGGGARQAPAANLGQQARIRLPRRVAAPRANPHPAQAAGLGRRAASPRQRESAGGAEGGRPENPAAEGPEVPERRGPPGHGLRRPAHHRAVRARAGEVSTRSYPAHARRRPHWRQRLRGVLKLWVLAYQEECFW
jgi:hypothetical protein